MNIESKIWKRSNTGTKVHAFDGGVALCNSSIRRFTSDAGFDYCEARTRTAQCANCVIKFNAIIEAAETEAATEKSADSCTCADRKSADHSHYLECPVRAEAVTVETPAEQDAIHPDAGTYNPMDGADYLKVQGLYVVAEVHTDGTYAVFAQSQRIDRGRLNGTEGSLMRFFTNIARLWSARIDDERAQEAARRAEAEYAHHAEADPVPAARAKTPEEIATVVEALGGMFKLCNVPSGREEMIHANAVSTAIEYAPQYGFRAEMRDNPEGHEYPWHVALVNRQGQKRAEYHYMGH